MAIESLIIKIMSIMIILTIILAFHIKLTIPTCESKMSGIYCINNSSMCCVNANNVINEMSNYIEKVFDNNLNAILLIGGEIIGMESETLYEKYAVHVNIFDYEYFNHFENNHIKINKITPINTCFLSVSEVMIGLNNNNSTWVKSHYIQEFFKSYHVIMPSASCNLMFKGNFCYYYDFVSFSYMKNWI